jgi:hypothetical protein
VVPIEIQILIAGVGRGEIAWASMPETLGTPASVSRKYSLRVRSLTARPERAQPGDPPLSRLLVPHRPSAVISRRFAPSLGNRRQTS